MVVILRLPTLETGSWQARAGWPSRCTVQAPQAPMPQPYLVPTRPRESRSAHSSGVSASTSTAWALPLMLKLYLLIVGAVSPTRWPDWVSERSENFLQKLNDA